MKLQLNNLNSFEMQKLSDMLKILSLTCILSMCNFSYSQTKMPDINSFKPRIDWSISFWDTIKFSAGQMTLFVQNCSDEVPKNLTNESVGFQLLFIKENVYRSVIYFEDTLISKVIYHYRGKPKPSVFQLFKLDKNEFTLNEENTFHYSEIRENILINCWYNRERFFYQEEIR